MGAAFSHLGFDEKNILTHIDAIDDGLFPGIFANHILIEESKGALVWRSGESNKESIEIIQHLLPDIVDGTVTLIDNDTVKKFRWVLFVVDYLFSQLTVCRSQLVKRCLLRRLIQFLPFQDGVHSLDSTNTHLHILGNIRTFQPAYPVNLGERPVVIIGPVSKKLPLCLFAQAFGIHQEQHTVDLGVFQQAVYRRNGCKGLARAGGHLNQRSGSVLCKRLLQTLDSSNLTTTEARRIKRWKMLHAIANCILRLQ